MTTTFEDVVTHRDAMVDVFTEITRDCVLLGLRPCHVSVSSYSPGSISADVQFSGKGLVPMAAVDALAGTWDLPPDNGTTTNYTRTGRLDLDGRRVLVTIYTGRSKHPGVPAGYTPQAVEAEPEPSAGCSCGARGDLDFILEHVCPLDAQA